jgi:hypothetical protein
MAAATDAACSKARWASLPEHIAVPQALLRIDSLFRNRDPRRMTKSLTVLRTATLALACAALASCQSGKKEPSGSGKSASLRAMEQVAIAAHKCWIASKDPAFKSYQMANELNNFGGTPRFLLVPARHYGGKPLLVVQATGNSSRVEVFGPLMAEPLGQRIGSDVARWQTGSSDCGAKA